MYVSLSKNVNVHFLLQNELVALQEEDHHFFHNRLLLCPVKL